MSDRNGGGMRPATRPRLLMIEDNPDDAVLLRATLEGAGAAFEILHASRFEEALAMIRAQPIDVLLLDLHLPDSSGLETVRRCRAEASRIPVVVMTGLRDLSLGIESVRCGAQDFLVKDDLHADRLVNALTHAIERERVLLCLRESATLAHRAEMGLHRIVHGVSDAIVIVDTDNRITFANQAAVALFRIPALDLVGAPFGYNLAAGVESDIEIRTGDRTISAEMRVVDVLWEDAPARLVTLRDVSERREAAERRMQLEMTGEFLAHVSHELRTPLSSVYQFVSNVRDGLAGPVTDGQAAQLDIALRNVDEALAMFEQLLEVARAEAGKLRFDPRIGDVAHAIEDVVGVMESRAESADIRLTFDVAPDLPPMLADPARVRQVLANIIGNSIKFTSDGGTITVRAGLDPDEPGAIRVSVEDTGCGMNPEDAKSVFERLYQVENGLHRSRRGLGLGLFISRELVTHQNGRIWVESEIGRGSVFHFTVPVFFLTAVLRPILEDARAARHGVHLLQIHAGWPEHDGDEQLPAALRRRLQTVVEAGVAGLPHVLLPNLEGETNGLTFNVLTCAPPDELARVRDALDVALQNETIVREFELATRFRLEPVSKPGRAPDEPEAVQRIEKLQSEGRWLHEDAH